MKPECLYPTCPHLPGTLLVIRRQSGTQIVRIVRCFVDRAADTRCAGFILSARSASWSKRPRVFLRSAIVGRADYAATARQRAAIEAAGDLP